MALAAHDHGVELALLEGIDEWHGQIDADVEMQFGIERVHSREQRSQIGACGMITDPDRQPYEI